MLVVVVLSILTGVCVCVRFPRVGRVAYCIRTGLCPPIFERKRAETRAGCDGRCHGELIHAFTRIDRAVEGTTRVPRTCCS